MAHSCPECGQLCHCGGDIDDCLFDGTKYELLCRHCDDCDEGDREDPEASENAQSTARPVGDYIAALREAAK